MSTPATRSRENTRARLLEAAAQVFAEVGLEGATVEAVCERAGFTRGAFYSNFESKDELFLALSASVAESRLNAVRERVAALAAQGVFADVDPRSEEHTSELQSRENLVCRLLLEKKKAVR